VQGDVAAGRLPELVRGRRHVEHVVGDLEREPDGLAVVAERGQPARIGACGDAADAGGRRDERAGLRAVDALELLERVGHPLALEVELLAADHAAGARRAHQLAHHAPARVGGEPSSAAASSAQRAASGTIASPAAVAAGTP
jgi:hypothetical protein